MNLTKLSLFIIKLMIISMIIMVNGNHQSSSALRRINRSTDNLSTETTMSSSTMSSSTNDDDIEMEKNSRPSRQIQTSTTTNPTTMDSSDESHSSSSSSMKPEESGENDENNNENEEEDGDDPWADVDDDDETILKSGKLNIVDQMRQLREEGRYIPYEIETDHMNETIKRVVAAYEIIDQFYLPSRETWEKLLGLVTGLDVTVQPECFASYFQGVSGFRGYETWAYRCMFSLFVC